MARIEKSKGDEIVKVSLMGMKFAQDCIELREELSEVREEKRDLQKMITKKEERFSRLLDQVNELEDKTEALADLVRYLVGDHEWLKLKTPTDVRDYLLKLRSTRMGDNAVIDNTGANDSPVSYGVTSSIAIHHD